MKTYLFAFLILAATSADAGLNKWVDEHGKVHYSDQPPPTGAQKIPLRAAPPPASEPAPTKTYGEREAEARKSRQSKAEAEERDAMDKANLEIEQSNCVKARKRLELMQEANRMVASDANGERRYLNDEERRQRLTETRREVDEWCKQAGRE